jgi:polysaccharide export outer membrane protein
VQNGFKRGVVSLFPLPVVWVLLFAGATSTRAQQPAQQQPSAPVTQRNVRLQQLAAAEKPLIPTDYTLGAGDLLKIDVFDVPELSREVRVSATGYISLPLIPGKIRASGLTSYQLEQKIADLLEANQLVTHPQVSVFVVEHVSESIAITGAVAKPMVYQAIRPTTLLEALAAAGGTTSDAGDYILVTHDVAGAAENGPDQESLNGPVTVKISLTDLVDKADPKTDIVLHGGDIVTVPRAGQVYVLGAVGAPGGYPLHSERERMTTLQAVALARGMKGTAKSQNAVILRKDAATGKTEEIHVNLKKILHHEAEDVQLYANDILFVPDSSGKVALWRAAEAGIAVGTGIAVLQGAH